jgi:hypothetical protein
MSWLRSSLRSLALGLYEHSPRAADAALQSTWLAALRDGLHPARLERLRGTARGVGCAAEVLVAGERPWIDYLPDRFFEGPPAREPLGRLAPGALEEEVARRGAELTVLRVDRRRGERLAGFLAVPETLGCGLATPPDPSLLARASSDAKEDIRVVRREGLDCELSHDVADCEPFHRTMHAPLMSARHGHGGVVHSVPWLRRRARRGGILWVRRGSERIAGAVLERDGDVLRLVALGSRDGDPAHARRGALTAVYWFAIRHAAEQGIPRIDMGGTPPLLGEGVIPYKRKWGARLDPAPITPYEFRVRWSPGSRAVRAFLAASPLVFRAEGRLLAVTSGREASEDEAQRVGRAFWMPGVERLHVLVDDGPAEPHVVPPRPRHERRGAGDVALCRTAWFKERFGLDA